MILVKLFLSFLKIGAFAMGGAYSFLPLIEREAVEKYHWLTKEEFLDLLGVATIFPGAISVKYATYIGYKIAGIPGAIMANLGNVVCPAVLIIFALGLYVKYKDLPGVKGAFRAVHLTIFAMIIAVAFRLVNVTQLIELKGLLIVIVSFTLFSYTKIHPALIILSAALIGTLLKL